MIVQIGVAHAQFDPSTAGRSYVVAFPDTTKNTFDARYPNTRFEDKCFFLIYSAVNTNVTIKGRAYERSVTVAAGTFGVVDLMSSEVRAPSPVVWEPCKPVDNTFRIEANDPIILHQVMVTKFGAEAWTPLPLEAWGVEYFAAAMPGEIGSDISPGGEFDYNRKNKALPAEIIVIAAYDDTKLTIVANGQIHNNCNTTGVTLKAGEAYLVHSFVDTLSANFGMNQGDFGGSRITSTKPVGVISGNTRAQIIDENIGLGKNIFKNMSIEWISPVGMHGTEFVYMPSWDGRRPTGNPNEDPAEKRKAEFVRLYGSRAGQTQGFYIQGGASIPYDSSFGAGEFYEQRHTPNLARVHRTTQPAQAMMASAAIVKYAGTTNGFGGYIGAAYDGWGGYMVELTPRHRWTRFAPFFAPTHPAGMEYFINVVTDTNHMHDVLLKNGSEFVFNRPIEGTDLIWGSMSVPVGVTEYLDGRNGAVFAGYVYGTLSRGGHEEYRPGRVRERDDDPPMRAGGTASDDESTALHPSEYEEYLAVAWAYPLASTHQELGPGDEMSVTSGEYDCKTARFTSEATNENPVGLSSVSLENSVNARVLRTEPSPISGSSRADAFITPIDPSRNAAATVVFTDRTGNRATAPYSYVSQSVGFSWAVDSEFPRTRIVDSTHRLYAIQNTSPRDIEIRSITFAKSTVFKVRALAAPLPITLKPAETFDVLVAAVGSAPRGRADDIMRVQLDCIAVDNPVSIVLTAPCIEVEDVNFFNLDVGETGTRIMRLCNPSPDTLRLDPNPATVITWLGGEFTITNEERQRIAGAVIAPSDCLPVNVSLKSNIDGKFMTIITVRSNTVGCRDTAFWKGSIGNVGGVTGSGSEALSYFTNEPNPFSGTTELRFGLEHAGHTTIRIYNSSGEIVRTLIDAHRSIGDHTVTFDANGLPSGSYHCRISSGDWSQTRTIIVR
ncbi:MAG: T9SS type A sorting domain-containing protein [bacterium]|nr:T9SS type A sorting domain-containing protein [Candidatus Kapabacteria bacterium]